MASVKVLLGFLKVVMLSVTVFHGVLQVFDEEVPCWCMAFATALLYEVAFPA